MKIILLGPAHPLRGGIATFSENLAMALQKEGHEVEIISFSLQYPDFLFPGKTQYSSDPAPKDLKIKVWMNSIHPFNWIAVGLKIRKMQPDLVICKYWLPLMAPCLGTILRIVKRKGTHINSLAHNVIPHEKRPGDWLFTKYFVGAVDSFCVLSQSVKDDIQQFSKNKPTTVTPHPIYDSYGVHVPKSEAREHLGLEQDGKYLLFFGFIRKYKGLDLLLEAMADERIQQSNIKAIIAGEYYEDKAIYDSIIEKHGLADRVIVHDDFIPNEEVRYYFGAADVVVQPYRTATQSGISQLAYHFEKPMIVTNVGGLPEIVDNGAGYVVEVNPTAIADAILDFYTKNRETEMTANVIENKKRYSWSNLVKVIFDFIK
jgi:glycosyltransferase involved in cell wall biosynthesis